MLEGEKEDVAELNGKIENDPRHHTIIRVMGRNIQNGSFDSYKAETITEEKI